MQVLNLSFLEAEPNILPHFEEFHCTHEELSSMDNKGGICLTYANKNFVQRLKPALHRAPNLVPKN